MPTRRELVERIDALDFLIEENAISYFVLRLSIQSMSSGIRAYRAVLRGDTQIQGQRVQVRTSKKKDAHEVQRWVLRRLQTTWNDRAAIEAQALGVLAAREALLKHRHELLDTGNNK